MKNASTRLGSFKKHCFFYVERIEAPHEEGLDAPRELQEALVFLCRTHRGAIEASSRRLMKNASTRLESLLSTWPS